MHPKKEPMTSNEQQSKENTQPIMKCSEDELDIRELFSALWQGKLMIISICSLFAISSVFYTLSLPDVYKSEVLLAPAGEQMSSGLSGQLGGIAALAGVNLGIGGGGVDKTALAIEVVQSRDFLGRFIEQYDLFVPVMAAEGWSRDDNSLVIDGKIYDSKKSQWLRDMPPPFQPKPSVQETFIEFNKLLTVSQDKATGLVEISIDYYSPYLAKQWLENLVKMINEEMRNRDLIEAQKSITYLNAQLEQTNIADFRTMLYSLIEEQTKTLMLANVREEYVLKTIDPAVVAEKKAKPARALIVIMAVILGAMLSALVVLVRYFNRK